VAAPITSGNANFKYYKSGVLPDCAGEAVVNHMIVVVGLTLNMGKGNYWIIKNSWGTKWGEGGYIRIAYTTSSCLICSYGGYAIVT
jgi:cathepsin L